MRSRKKLDFLHKKTTALLKLLSTSPQEPFEERIWHVLVFLGAWTDIFLQIPAKNFGPFCRNCIVGGQRSLLQKTSVSGKANSLSCFWFRIFSVRSLVYLQKNIGKLSFVKIEFHPFIGISWGQKTEKFLVRLSDFRRKQFKVLARYLVATLSELPCKCPDESFGKKMEDFFFHFGWSAEKDWTFGTKKRQLR